MTARHVVIRIDRIVVDAACLRGQDAGRVQAAIEAELTALLTPSQGAALSGGAVRSAAITNPVLASSQSPTAVGTEIARSIHAIVMGAR